MRRGLGVLALIAGAAVLQLHDGGRPVHGQGRPRQIQTSPGAVRPVSRPCPGATETDVFHVYSECNARDRMWHVVTDREYMCTNPDGSTYAQTVRVADQATNQRCDDQPIDPNAQPRIRSIRSSDLAQVTFDDRARSIGIITLRECINGFWRPVEYPLYRSEDGQRTLIDRNRPTIGPPGEPCQPDGTNQRADARLPGTTGAPVLTLDPVGGRGQTALAAGPLLHMATLASAMNLTTISDRALAPAQRIAASESPEDVLSEIDEVMVIAGGAPVSPVKGFAAALDALFDLLQGPRLHAAQNQPAQVLFRSLGGSTGPILQMQVFKSGTGPVRLQGLDVVLEPLTDAGAKQLRDEIGRRSLTAARTLTMNGYCLEFLKTPPAAGSLFRIAPADVQQRFAPLRKIMSAARRAYRDGLLHPDSDRTEYFNSIRQWAVWSAEQRLDEQGFVRRFVEHSRKNVEGSGRPWNRSLEEAVRALAPNRWKDISAVLRSAETGRAR